MAGSGVGLNEADVFLSQVFAHSTRRGSIGLGTRWAEFLRGDFVFRIQMSQIDCFVADGSAARIGPAKWAQSRPTTAHLGGEHFVAAQTLPACELWPHRRTRNRWPMKLASVYPAGSPIQRPPKSIRAFSANFSPLPSNRALWRSAGTVTLGNDGDEDEEDTTHVPEERQPASCFWGPRAGSKFHPGERVSVGRGLRASQMEMSKSESRSSKPGGRLF